VQRGGTSGRRSRTYWMCSCGSWNWDWRSTCLSCGYAAPPRALGSTHGKAKPEADKDGWVDQPRGRRAQRQARSAASRTASTKSQTSASAAGGAPSGGGVTAIERLRATVERLEALQAGPPDGVDSCFTDVAANQLEAKRAELASAQQEAAEQKASAMTRFALLHKEASAISKVQPQKAQDELAALDGEVGEASRALQVFEEAAREEAEARRRQRAAEWAGASHVPGLLTQLDKLPEAWGSSNFEVAWAAIRTQVEAVRAQLAVHPSASERAPRAESCPVGEISSDDSELAGGSGPWQPQAAAERGQAERRGSALGGWPQVSQACKKELVAEAADLEARGAARSRRRAVSLRPCAPSDMESPLVHAGLGRLARSQKGVMDLLAAQEALPQPLGARAAVPVFFPESNGGVRPIVNGPLPMRIRGSPRQPIGALWEAEHDRRFFRGKVDREYEKAGWLHNACAALARVRGCASASLFLDITKLYVSLRHDFLRQCGVEHGFDLRVLRGLHVLYPRPRILLFAGLATESFASLRGALGCKWVASSAFRLCPLSAAEAPVRALRPSGERQPGGHWETQGWTFGKTLQARNLSTGAAIAGRSVHESRVRAPGAVGGARGPPPCCGSGSGPDPQ
ncbi:unnamed protein product, partial [Prorocentrum cordatum]